MAALLSVTHMGNGYSRITYDVGVDKTAVLTVRTEDVQSILDIPADDVVGDVLDVHRAVERRPGRS